MTEVCYCSKHGTAPVSRGRCFMCEQEQKMSPEEYMTEMQGNQPVRKVPRFPEASTSAMEQRYNHATRGLHNCDNVGLAAAGAAAINRAVHNSPPPLDDVGGGAFEMLDEEDPVAILLNERQVTHGSFANNAHYGQTLRTLFRQSPGWARADDRTREVLDYLAGKLSRVLSGNPNERQHWEDCAGYATLQFHPDKQR